MLHVFDKKSYIMIYKYDWLLKYTGIHLHIMWSYTGVWFCYS